MPLVLKAISPPPTTVPNAQTGRRRILVKGPASRPGVRSSPLEKGDFVLVRTSAPFTLTSNADVEPVDSVAAVAAKQEGRLKLGSGQERPISLHMGKVLFSTANEDLLPGFPPPIIKIPSHSRNSTGFTACFA